MESNWKTKIDNIIVRQKKYRDHDFRAKDLAEMLDISIFQLARMLKKEYGQSYADIVLTLRIDDAKKHLLSPNKTDLTIEEIGLLCGFNNKWSFHQAFRKYAGCTPAEWRKEFR